MFQLICGLLQDNVRHKAAYNDVHPQVKFIQTVAAEVMEMNKKSKRSTFFA